jgi:hypothetical protein
VGKCREGGRGSGSAETVAFRAGSGSCSGARGRCDKSHGRRARRVALVRPRKQNWVAVVGKGARSVGARRPVHRGNGTRPGGGGRKRLLRGRRKRWRKRLYQAGAGWVRFTGGREHGDRGEALGVPQTVVSMHRIDYQLGLVVTSIELTVTVLWRCYLGKNDYQLHLEMLPRYE